MMKRLILVQVLWVFLCCVSSAQTARIDSLLNTYHKNGELNGTVLVARKGEIIYKNAFGIANADWNIKNTIDSKFHLFSVTKQFTAVLVFQLVEKGLIDLDKTISDYLGYYRKDTGTKITVHHLLTHSHGIPNYDYRKMPMELAMGTEEFITQYASSDLTFVPGSKYKYSPIMGYTLLAAIIEKVTNKSYEQVLNEQILQPAGMTNSGFIHFDRSVDKMTTSYLGSPQKKRLHFFMFGCNGSSAIYSTAEDLYRYSKALKEHRLISGKSLETFFSPVLTDDLYTHTYGGGYMKTTINGEEVEVVAIEGGGRNIMATGVNNDLFIAVLNNTYSPASHIFYNIFELLYK